MEYTIATTYNSTYHPRLCYLGQSSLYLARYKIMRSPFRFHPPPRSPRPIPYTTSYYGFYDAEIDYIVCNKCKEETFTWLADMFRCTTCGGSEFVSPTGVDFGKARGGESGNAEDVSLSSVSTMKKRKWMGSDEDSMSE
jgi:hypothetical protein